MNDASQPPEQARTIYEGRMVTLRLVPVSGPDGRQFMREIVEHADAVAVVAVDDEDRVLLVRQARPAAGETLLELPAGNVEPGESPETCAARELEEETAIVPGHLEPLLSFYTSPGFCTELIYVFLATDLREGTANPDEDEDIEVVREPVDRLADLVAGGAIRDAKTAAGLLAFLQRRAASSS